MRVGIHSLVIVRCTRIADAGINVARRAQSGVHIAWGHADSPSDVQRPSSAQHSISRGDCAWTNKIFRKPYPESLGGLLPNSGRCLAWIPRLSSSATRCWCRKDLQSLFVQWGSINPNQEKIPMRNLLWLVTSIVAAFLNTAAMAQELDWQKVDEIFGRKAAVSGDVHRYGFPRGDLSVTLDGVAIKPAFALGGWVAFKPAHGGAMVMGDLVLLESEINPVMLKLIEGGMEITAVHNHLLRANPATFYMHVGGHGDPVKMATVIHDALAASKTPLATTVGAAPPPAPDLNAAQLEQIIGAKSQANGGILQFSVPRRDAVSEHGTQLVPPGPTGVATGINFQPTGGGKAAITGDFVLIPEEVNPVVKALRANGIEVTAIH